jgi:hypothetical protein
MPGKGDSPRPGTQVSRSAGGRLHDFSGSRIFR